MPHGSGCRAVCLLAALLLLFGLSPPSFAQQITYQYDALGRLILVSTPEGVAQYEYDAVGNLLRIVTHKYADVSGPVAILGMSPSQGAPGTLVQLFGRGFGATPAENQVAFNGTPAPVTAATAGMLTVTVPADATTGPVTVTAPQGSATSIEVFTVTRTFGVSPTQADVALGAAVGFRALLGGAVTPDVTWRINGVGGGNVPLGTVTPAGIYTAPPTPPPTEPIAVEAVLTADPTQVARATVRVVGPAAGGAAARPLAVAGAMSGTALAAAQDVSVGTVPTGNAQAAAGAVSLTGGPVVGAISPSTGPPGASVLALTLSGRNLQAASALRILQNGAVDATVGASAPSPAPDGNALTVTLAIGSTAPRGPRVLQVITPQGTSTSLDLGTNRFTVSAP